MKITFAALSFFLSLGVAHAQSVDGGHMSSTVDATRAYYTGGSPGTIGAMDVVASGIATNPQDVALQQQGHGTMADKASAPDDAARVEASGYASGTVGATPGSMPASTR